MNYYSIEFFKDNLKELSAYIKRMQKLSIVDTDNLALVSAKLDGMITYVKDREESNKFAYSKQHMRKISFK